MNGAESLVRTLLAGGVEVSFANPGTSEMHFVSALDRVDGMRCVLCLFEGGATGAADGYARMADKPASTLLHLGPGLANGTANLHNARRARSPMVNVVGEHAVHHLPYDSPLTSDIEALARTQSAWVRTSRSSMTVAADGADAIAAARSGPGGIATLILPADTAWGEGGPVAAVPAIRPRAKVDAHRIEEAAELLQGSARVVLFIGDRSLRADGIRLAAGIAERTGARVLTQFANARTARGTGVPSVDRIPYPVDAARTVLEDFECMILVGAVAPVAFFAYPGKPSALTPSGCRIVTLAEPADDQIDALERLSETVGGNLTVATRPHPQPELPKGPITPTTIGMALGALLPDGAIVCDESITTGRDFLTATRGAPPHDWLQMTGGSIGIGIPLATGAAIASPNRKVVTLQADGSGLYTAQALWTQAREKLDVLTLIWANRSYATLYNELKSVGATAGRKADRMLTLDDPPIDWVSLAKSYGVEAVAVTTAEDLVDAIRIGLARRGPFLIEVIF